MITILTPSNRNIEGLRLVERALIRQSEDFEWIIGSPEEPEGLKIPFKYVQDPPKKEGDYWVLNKLYNEMIRQASGDLLISVQDFTYFDPDGLSKFAFHYSQNPNAIISGVGNKYADDTWTAITWKDPRQRDDMGSFYEVHFADVEGNYCAVPKEAILDVGGFDEDLDQHAGMDWYSVLERMDMTGKYKFYLDQTNESYSLEHGRYDDWEARNAIHGPYQERRKNYGKGVNFI